MDISAWLRELGLERYGTAFRDNDIDAAVLRTLSAEDLKELGVTSLGHRKKLLEAIAVLGSQTPVGASMDTAVVRPEAERRQLTVLFCDLVGSTALSSQLDPEDMREVIGAYQKAVACEIGRLEGHVAKFMGDGVLAYFGWPRAHEDEPEQAVRAALAIVEAVRALSAPSGEPLACRIGIATGLVVVGDLVGQGAAQEEAVVGATPNLAARLQSIADAGQVVLAQSTRRLLGNLFELEDLGTHDLKGIATPAQAWRVIAEHEAVSRFEALRGAQLAAFVGRRRELSLLLDCWERAKAGQGQVVLLSGEAGIGKSRIARALRERLAGESLAVITYGCSPHHTNTALYPVTVLLERAAHLTHDDPAATRLDKLEASLARGGRADAEKVRLLAALLGIETGRRYPPLALDAERRKQRTLEVLTRQLAEQAARQPVLALWEDVQWADPTTLELLGLMIEGLSALPVLMLVTFRPELDPPWKGLGHVTQLQLGRLDRRDCVDLIGRITGGKRLPAEVLEPILARTDGVPLFVEELTKTVLESGLIADSGDRYALVRPLPPLAIPATLHDSLMAQLDRLAPVKEVAQIAACIGRDFTRHLLSEVVGPPPSACDQALDELAKADLIAPGPGAGPSYSFRHVLIRDIAYSSLVRPRRQELHARIARALRKCEPEICKARPELLAYHLTEAGELVEAVDQWLKAGRRATALSANREAIEHLSYGLELLKRLPDDQAHRQRALELLISRGPPQIVLYGAATREVAENYAEALALADTLPETRAHFAAHWGWWHISADHQEQEERGAYLLDLAARLRDNGLIMQAHHCQWATQLNLGHLHRCRQHVDTGLALYDAGAYEDEISLYGGHDAKVCGLGNAAIVAWLLGDAALAERRIAEVLAWARRIGHVASQVHALESTSQVSFFARDPVTLRALATELMLLAAEHKFAGYHAKAKIYLGWVTAQDGDVAQGLDMAGEGLTKFREVSTSSDSPFFANIHAELLGMVGEVDAALAELQQTLDDMARGSLSLWLPELQRCYGELLVSRGPASHAEAEAWFKRAMTSADDQGASALFERAASSLVRLRRSHGAGGAKIASSRTGSGGAADKRAVRFGVDAGAVGDE